MSMFRALVTLSLTFLFALPSGLAQSRGDSTYYIEGIVVDPSGNPIKHARLTLGTYTFTRQGATFSTDDGKFIFERLTESNYKLDVSASGFQNYQESIGLFTTSRNLRIVLTPIARDDGTPRSLAPVVSTSALAVPAKAREEYEKALVAEKNKDLKSAERHLKKALSVYPAYAAALAAQGFLFLDEQKPAEAEAAFQKALRMDASLSDAWLGIGRIRNAESRFQEAETNLLKAQSGNPDAWQVNYELGRASIGLGKDSEAETQLRKAAASSPGYPPVYYLLAQVLLRLNRPLEAVPEMEAYLRLAPAGPTADKVRELIKRIKQAER